MENKKHINRTNSRVGFTWSKEASNDMKNKFSKKSIKSIDEKRLKILKNK